MISRETGKDRAARIPYDYQHQPDRQIRRRLLLSLGALVAVLIWLARGHFDDDGGRLRASHGPLARVHATWEAECAACHVSPPEIGVGMWNQPYGVVSKVGDAKCKACHMTDSDQAHHPTRMAVEMPHCASCHSEHRGAEVSLVRRDKDQCTSCHRDLDKVRVPSPGPAPIDGTIAHFFDASHPSFRSAKADPGRLKFNHALHMTEGLKFRPDDKSLFTFAWLREADRARYGWQKGMKLEGPVKLECASCHRLDESEKIEGDGTPRSAENSAFLSVARPRQSSAGAMIPIRFANQCAACHPLDVSGADRDDPNLLLNVRHGVQPAALHDDLTARCISTLLIDDQRRLDDLEPRRFPGRRPEAESARREVERRVATVERILFARDKGTCTECHHYDTPDDQPVMRPNGIVDPARFHVVVTRVPSPWFKHGFFDHSAHRALNCRACHSRAYSDDEEASGRAADVQGPAGSGLPRLKNGNETWTANEDVLLPGITACQGCHSPLHRSGNRPHGGAQHECLECHTYHNREDPPEGLGPAARGAQQRRDIFQFLRGIDSDPGSKRAPAPGGG